MAGKRDPLWHQLEMLLVEHPRWEKPFIATAFLALLPLCLLAGWTYVKYPRFTDQAPGSDGAAWVAGVVFWLGAIVLTTGMWWWKRWREKD